MTSLRRRLFVLLLAATGVLWLLAVIWIYVGSRIELEHVLDTRLQEAARMVHSLVPSGNVPAAASTAPFQEAGYEKQLSCQIWSLDGRLLARSSGAPSTSLAQDDGGFADRTIGGERWRVYTIVDAQKGVRVAVGDRIGLRDRLVRDLVLGLIGPALIIVPLLGALIWFGVGRGLSPLERTAADIAARDGDDMRPIADAAAPSEVRPLLQALNGLFGKVDAARRHERDVTAFAAHELRTPLAGLKTQAQVALAARDDGTRASALRQIIASVDRATRLTRQLLTLAKLDAMPPRQQEAVDVGRALQDAMKDCRTPPDLQVTVDPRLNGLVVSGDREHLHLVLRNLHENALEHTRAEGRISWSMLPDGAGMMIEDEGPGIAEDEIALVTQRFYRTRGTTTPGTGLGLAIASIATDRLGMRLAIANLDDRCGLRCTLNWPSRADGF
ncbi:sensor histidine kinase [Mesorhizobium sp. 1M-11]|uniref:sensor histidine kinase n=1 Tax=Mesorhizobium sp. 1M-11 TaxID=1529006 RepID=UPI0006C76025|nr:sensor histidine kinase [Mesorhizobium sp. 1M-11]